jgi:hypothetical protein
LYLSAENYARLSDKFHRDVTKRRGVSNGERESYSASAERQAGLAANTARDDYRARPAA